MELIGVDQDGTVHLLHLLFSVLVGLYSTAWWLFSCRGDLPCEGLSPLVELTVDAFAVRGYMRATPKADLISHLE